LTAQVFNIHPVNPQQRLVAKSQEVLAQGGVLIYPTDSCYALGCALGMRDSLERIRRIKSLGKHHLFTLACSDLAQIADYAKVNNIAFRLIRNLTPGPFTFILPARNKVPRNLQHPTRKTIGVRIPNHPILTQILQTHGEPIFTTSLIFKDDLPYNDIETIKERYAKQVDLIVDGGVCGNGATTVIDLVSGQPEVLREGLGEFVG
jgi:tRNA threonylcarbamoyl adenosine modification protein (Sua5/YciO/YrdC/YwlC family)